MLALLLSVPAGFTNDPADEHEIWFYLAAAPIPGGILVVAVGVLVGRVATRAARRRSAGSQPPADTRASTDGIASVFKSSD